MSEADDRAGELVLGRFRLQRRIGGGAMGDVYVAAHEGLGRLVAVKILRSAARPASRARFRREATIAARLMGVHIVRVTDFGELPDGAPFLVMDFVDGPTLAAELTARGALPATEAVGRCLEVCEALAEAHRAGIVHRDIKPANLLLARSPEGARVLRVSDFGVAKAEGESTLTGDGASLGSPSYMAPEQIDDPHGVDGRADLWAVGVVLFELLTGARPFDGPTVPATLIAVSQANAPRVDTLRPDLPTGLGDVVARCLQKDAAARYDSASSLADALAPFGPDGANAVAARIRRVGAATSSIGTMTLDPDTPALVPASDANGSTVTGGVTAPPVSPTVAPGQGSRNTKLGSLLWPPAVVGIFLAGAILTRASERQAPVTPPANASADLSESGRADSSRAPQETSPSASLSPATAPEAAASLRAGYPPALRVGNHHAAARAVGTNTATSRPPASSARGDAPPAGSAKQLGRVLTTEVDDLGPRK